MHPFLRLCLGTAVLPAMLCVVHAQEADSSTSPLRSYAIVLLQEAAMNRLPSAEAERMVAGRAREVMAALKSGSAIQLAGFVHPVHGVRFSPYAYVTPGEDLVFTGKQVHALETDRREYVWGSFDGTGDAIRLSYKAYHRRFIYDQDFAHAKRVAYNGELMGHGNTLNNIRASYPRAILVEYHFPGFDPKYEGMDWRSLWLAFEKDGDKWYLVGIVHDEWTI